MKQLYFCECLQRDCNNEVEWFKQVMAQQGSVKETSFGQLDACSKHGTFHVGQRGADIFHNMFDIVKLTVDSKHGRVYTLDGLKDLESKLVLITGSKDERRKTVDGFLDVSSFLCLYGWFPNILMYIHVCIFIMSFLFEIFSILNTSYRHFTVFVR